MVEVGKWVVRMGCADLGGTCIANYGNHTSAFPSKFEEIMSKYRPIAPKPTIVSQNLHECNSNSDYGGVLNSGSRFAKAKGNHGVEDGRPRRARKRALDCCVSPSARGQKRARGRNTARDLASQQSHAVGIGSGSIRVERSKIACFCNCSFMVDGLIIDKNPYLVESSASPSVRTMLDYKNVGLGVFNIEDMMSSVGDVSVRNPSDCMEVVSLQKMPEEDGQCGCGSAKCLFFPILDQIQHEENKRNNLVTLPLLPEAPSLKESVLGSPASNLSSTFAYSEHKAGNASHDKEEFQLRLFGRDLSPQRNWK